MDKYKQDRTGLGRLNQLSVNLKINHKIILDSSDDNSDNCQTEEETGP